MTRLCFTSHWVTDICTNTEVHPLPVRIRSKVLRQAHGTRAARAHTAVSVCLSRHFNCYIFSALIWAKREASAEPGTSKATSPSLTSCLSLWSSIGFGEPAKGIGEAVWIPGWNEFDGLIVAPSGHRHTSQRAGRAEAVDEELQLLENTPASFPLHLWISAHGSLVPLISASCLEHMSEIVPTHITLFLNGYLIYCAAHFSFLFIGYVNLATPLSSHAHFVFSYKPAVSFGVFLKWSCSHFHNLHRSWHFFQAIAHINDASTPGSLDQSACWLLYVISLLTAQNLKLNHNTMHSQSLCLTTNNITNWLDCSGDQGSPQLWTVLFFPHLHQKEINSRDFWAHVSAFPPIALPSPMPVWQLYIMPQE